MRVVDMLWGIGLCIEDRARMFKTRIVAAQTRCEDEVG